MNWFRWYYGTYSDPKFAVVAKRCGQPRHVVLAVWAALLETAGNAMKRGDVSSFDPETIGLALDLEAEVVTAVFTAFMSKELITKDRHVAAWEKRQHYDYSTDRVRDYRARKAQEAAGRDGIGADGTHDETVCNDVKRNETQETPDQIRTDQIINQTAPQGGADVSPKRMDDGKRGTRLAPDWQPSAEDRAFAAEHGFEPHEVERIAAEFRDYWCAESGQRARKLDWSRTWHNRIRALAQHRAHHGRAARRESGGVVETYAQLAGEFAARRSAG